MRQKNYWSYFAFIQIRLVESKIVPAELLLNEAKRQSSLSYRRPTASLQTR